MKYQEKAESRDTVRPSKRLLDCYIETGTEHQVLSPCNDDDGDDDDDGEDELQVDGFVDGCCCCHLCFTINTNNRVHSNVVVGSCLC